MLASELYDEYLKLSDLERIKFENLINSYKKEQEKKLNQTRNEIYNEMSRIVNENGTPYFDKKHLKNNIRL